MSERGDAPETGGATLEVRPPRGRQLLSLGLAVLFVLAGLILTTGPGCPRRWAGCRWRSSG